MAAALGRHPGSKRDIQSEWYGTSDPGGVQSIQRPGLPLRTPFLRVYDWFDYDYDYDYDYEHDDEHEHD